MIELKDKIILASIVAKVDPEKLSGLELDRAFDLILEAFGTCQAFQAINDERNRRLLGLIDHNYL